MNNKYKLHVISQTHWDREWYQTFQGFRKRLVYMMDTLISHMEQDPEYKFFHMDGQTITLEDYLDIRPENEARLRKLVREGRILIGPWYVMPDEFLVSGESLVRNIQKGFELCEEYGTQPLKNGYVVDIFGHNSQFPQILNGFGITAATLYRGIGDYPKDAFTWEAADGSQVLCFKLDRDRSYSNFYFAVRWPFDGRDYEKEELVSRMRQLLDYSSKLAVSENLLMMDGVDHIEIETRLPQVLSLLNDNIEEIEITQSTLEEFEAAQRRSAEKLEVLKGELYHVGERGINNQVLKNVLSSMVHLKQMNDACETLLTRWAEPFDAIASGVDDQHCTGFLRKAWTYLLQNHPHDSICGCSITRVHQDNEYRFHQVQDLGEEVLQQNLKVLARGINTAWLSKPNAIVLFHAGQQDFAGVVEADIELPAGSQNNFKLYSSAGDEIPYQLLSCRKSSVKGVFRYGYLPDFRPTDIFRIAFHAQIPSVGYSTYWYEEFKTTNPGFGEYSYREFHAPTRYPGSLQTGHKTWENEYLRLSVNENGSLNVVCKDTGKEYKDLLIFEDCADIGDGWNYRRPLKDSRHLSLGCKAGVSVENDGPVLLCLKIVQTLQLPVGMAAGDLERSREKADFTVTTLVKLRKGSRKLEFTTSVDNSISEHRLRVLFPSYLDTGSFLSSTPFYLQEREIARPDCSSAVEPDTGVYPNQGVVVLQDRHERLALYNKGLYEVEITEDASRTIALTLFRSFKNEVGQDRGDMSFMKRSMSFEYALEFGAAKSIPGEAMVSGEAWRTGIRSICTDNHGGTLGIQDSYLKLDIPGAVLCAYKNGKGGLKIVRFYNCSDHATTGSVAVKGTPKKAYLLDLNDQVQKELDTDGNQIKVELGAAKIMTIGLLL